MSDMEQLTEEFYHSIFSSNVYDNTKLFLYDDLFTNKTLLFFKYLENFLVENKQIKELKLKNLLTSNDNFLKFLNFLENNTTINSLNLTQNSINDNNINQLAKVLRTKKTIKSINLNSNNIGDDGIIYMALLIKTNKCIENLSFDYNNIKNKGLDVLMKVLQQYNNTVTSLSLSDNNISTEGLLSVKNCLANNKNIKYINLNNNLLSTSQLKELDILLKNSSKTQSVEHAQEEEKKIEEFVNQDKEIVPTEEKELQLIEEEQSIPKKEEEPISKLEEQFIEEEIIEIQSESVKQAESDKRSSYFDTPDSEDDDSEDDELLPKKLVPEHDTEDEDNSIESVEEVLNDFKNEGNSYYSKNNYEEAVKSYTSGIKLIKKYNLEEKYSVFYLNRAASYIALKRFVPALNDANLGKIFFFYYCYYYCYYC